MIFQTITIAIVVVMWIVAAVFSLREDEDE